MAEPLSLAKRFSLKEEGALLVANRHPSILFAPDSNWRQRSMLSSASAMPKDFSVRGCLQMM
jgi:hypothetical protein